MSSSNTFNILLPNTVRFYRVGLGYELAGFGVAPEFQTKVQVTRFDGTVVDRWVIKSWRTGPDTWAATFSSNGPYGDDEDPETWADYGAIVHENWS